MNELMDKGLSIIITYYKGEKYIDKCIDSIIQAHKQSSQLVKYEIILVIDSMADSDLIVDHLQTKYRTIPLRLFKNSVNIGVSRSRNVGLQWISYMYYTIMDQDDYVNPNYFSVLEKELDANIDVHLINGYVSFIHENKKVPIYHFPPKFTFRNLVLQLTTIYTPGLVIFNSARILPKELFIETSPTFKGCDDWAAYLNILLSNKVRYKYISDRLFTYCLHENNYSNNKQEMELSSISVIDFFLSEIKDKKSKEFLYSARARLRNQFLFESRINKTPTRKLLMTYHKQIFHHYILSFFNFDRLNRLVFRMRYFVS